MVRLGEVELGEERAGHRLVVVLSRVHEDLLVAGTQDRRQRRRLDELWTCPDDTQDPHRLRVAVTLRAWAALVA